MPPYKYPKKSISGLRCRYQSEQPPCAAAHYQQHHDNYVEAISDRRSEKFRFEIGKRLPLITRPQGDQVAEITQFGYDASRKNPRLMFIAAGDSIFHPIHQQDRIFNTIPPKIIASTGLPVQSRSPSTSRPCSKTTSTGMPASAILSRSCLNTEPITASLSTRSRAAV